MGSFFYGPEEETEDSGGTLRIPCADGEENNSQENSRSASSLNLAVAQPSTNSASDCGGDGTGAGCVVQALVECHATAVELLEEQQQQQQQQLPLSDVVVDERRSQQHCCAADNEQGEEGTSTEEEEEADAGKGQRIDLATVRRRRKQKQKQQQQHLQYRLQHGHDEQQQQQQPGAVVEQQQQQQHRRRQQQLMMATTESSSLETAEEADQSCCSSSIASSSSVTCREDADHTQQQCHHPQQMPPVSSQTEFAESAAHKVADEHHEYITMDKVSCCSDSFSHLAVPQQWERQQSSTGCCQEEICSCASDSGDSCYSSMANGQLNPRAFSFSSATDGSAGSGGGGTVSVTASAARAAVGRGSGGGRAEGRHWTMGVVSGMALHRNCGANGNNCHLVHLPPRTHHMSSSAVLPGTVMANPNCSNIIHHNNNCWPDSSSSSRFSMETSLITPLEEDEKQVSFGDEEERDKLCTEMNQRAGDELRKRAFSLGSKSWITKPFRKLSSTHGSGASSSSTAQHHHNHNQQQQQQQHNQHAHRQLHNSESARSCTSSLAGSVHADLSAPDPHHQQHQQHNSSSQTRLCHRLGSSSSFASCSITGHNNRSDSVGSAHSAAAFSLPGSSLMSQKLSSRRIHVIRTIENRVVNPVANRSAQCVPSTVDDTLRSSTRARTSSCDDHNQQQFATLHQLQQAMSTPLGMGRASASNALDRSQQRHHTRGWAGTRSSWSSQDQFTMMGQQQLRPSESFIRSIQQHQQELQQKNDQQQKRHKLKSDFPLQEVHCFIAPAEREKIDAVTSPRGDSLSMRSQRSGSGSTFETIQECAAGGATASIGPKRDSRASNRRPSSR
uniref:PEHE domain-containing protein n=1 Tax=Globodera pallida TaxID=36090 RepID=A0A183BPT6_GLOPA